MIFIPKQTLKQDLHVHGQFYSKIFKDQFVILAQNSLKSNGHYDGYNRNVSRFLLCQNLLKPNQFNNTTIFTKISVYILQEHITNIKQQQVSIKN